MGWGVSICWVLHTVAGVITTVCPLINPNHVRVCRQFRSAGQHPPVICIITRLYDELAGKRSERRYEQLWGRCWSGWLQRMMTMQPHQLIDCNERQSRPAALCYSVCWLQQLSSIYQYTQSSCVSVSYLLTPATHIEIALFTWLVTKNVSQFLDVEYYADKTDVQCHLCWTSPVALRACVCHGIVSSSLFLVSLCGIEIHLQLLIYFFAIIF